MTSKHKIIKIALDRETELKLKDAAARRGVSAEQFCSEAVSKELDSETPAQKFSAKGLIAAGEAVFRGRLSLTDSAELIRDAREERHRDSEGDGSS